MNIKKLQGFEQISTLGAETILEGVKTIKLRTWISMLGRPVCSFLVEKNGTLLATFKEDELVDAVDAYERIR